MPFPAGTKLDSYEIVAPLGTGGMGEVYRARDTALKRDVAIKVLPTYWSRDPDRLSRFELEAQAAAALSHPNIVAIFHVGEHDGAPYIVNELLKGETLRERLSRSPMRVGEVLEIGAAVAKGLAAAHTAGVIHRDLKPENLFLKRSRPILTPELEQRILDTTLKTRPTGATHWSARVLAAKLGVSRMMVQRVWQRYEVQPHRVEKFKISNDPKFEDKVRDVVGLYLDPPDRALVLCVDEKSQIQALDRTAPILPLRPGLPERQTHDYKRHGTTTLFAAFNILNGKVIGSCLPRHRGKEFIRFLNQLEKEVPPELDIHLILDNYSTHKSATVQRWLKPRKRRRFHFHFTPTSSSWLNQVERWFGLITDKMIRRGTFHSVEELERAIYAWLANCNVTPKAFVWKATADVILDKVRRW